MNAHERAQLLLSERLDGPLSLADARELQGHLVSCQACRGFADEMERLTGGLRALPRLPASPIVSRGVLDAIDGGMSGWGWLRRGFGFAGSPTVAIASSMALVAALAGTIYLAANPDGGQPDPQATSGAVAVAPEITAPAIVAPTEAPTREPKPEPTTPLRSIAPSRTPTPRPTSTPPPTKPANVRVTVIPTTAPVREPAPALAAVQPTIKPVDAPSAAPEAAMALPEEQAPERSVVTEAATTDEAEPAVRRADAGNGRRDSDGDGAAEVAQETRSDEPEDAASNGDGRDRRGGGREAASTGPEDTDAADVPADDAAGVPDDGADVPVEAASAPRSNGAAEPRPDEIPVEQAALAAATEPPATPDAADAPPDEAGAAAEPTIGPAPTSEPVPTAPPEPAAAAEPVPTEPSFGPDPPSISLPDSPESEFPQTIEPGLGPKTPQQPTSPPIEPVDGEGPATDDGGQDEGGRKRRSGEASEEQRAAAPIEPVDNSQIQPAEPIWVDPVVGSVAVDNGAPLDPAYEPDPALVADPALAPVDDDVWQEVPSIQPLTPTP